MRKIILIAAALLASVSAHAEGTNGQSTIASNEPVQQVEPARKTTVAEQLKEEPKPQVAVKDAKPQAAATEETTEAEPAPVKRVAKQKVHRESDEQKARRIAAHYGVYW